MNTKMFCWTRNVWGNQWREFKLKIIEYELMKSTKLLCFGLMIKYILNNRYDGLALGY